MSQVLYCLAAVLVFALFGLSRQTSEADDRRALDVLEVETAAHDVAQRWAARIRSLPFDEADRLRAAIRRDPVRDVADLTPESGFGPGLEGGETAPDDVDDLHGVSVRDTAWVGPARDRPLLFDVFVEVRYAATTASGTAYPGTPTLAKEARVIVLETQTAREAPVRVEVPVHTTAARQFLHAAAP